MSLCFGGGFEICCLVAVAWFSILSFKMSLTVSHGAPHAPPPFYVPTLPASTHSRHSSAHSSALCPSAIADSCTADERLKRKLLEVACKCASDQNSRIAHKWLQFTHELASQYGEDVVVALSELIPVCLKSLGSASSSVRKASVQVRCQHTAREQSNGRHAKPIIGALNLFAGSARLRAKKGESEKMLTDPEHLCRCCVRARRCARVTPR